MKAYVWALLAACVWGVVPILEKIGLHKVVPLTALFYRSFGVLLGIFLLGAFVLKPADFKVIDMKSLFVLVLSGFLASVVAQVFFYHGLKIGEVSRVVPIAGSFPLISFILGVFILGEAITPMKLVGILLVISGIWFLR